METLKALRKIWFTIALALLSTALCPGQKVYTPDNVPDVHRLNGSSYVSDPENILSASVRNRINSTAISLEDKTGAEMAVVVVPSIGNDTPESFSERLFQKWGIGKKGEDNGLLILLVTEDRYIRFEVGYGLEGVLTDAMSKRIQAQRMNQYLSRGDWDNGLLAGTEAVNELLTDPKSELLNENGQKKPGTDTFYLNVILILGTMAIIVVMALMMARMGKKCPRCGTKMDVVNQTASSISPGIRLITTTYRCPKCGYTTQMKRTQNVGAMVAGGLGGGLGGLGRGSGRGGRPGGWGGGRSGGGGATSRF